MRSAVLLLGLAVAGVIAEGPGPGPDPAPHEALYTSTLTVGDGTLVFAPAASWNLSDAADTAGALSGNQSEVQLPPAVGHARANASGASVSFSFFGAGFALRGTGDGELALSSNGGAEERRNVSSGTEGGVLLAHNSSGGAAWRNVTVSLARGSVNLSSVEVQHAVSIAANSAAEAPVLSVPGAWRGNASLNAPFYVFGGKWTSDVAGTFLHFR